MIEATDVTQELLEEPSSSETSLRTKNALSLLKEANKNKAFIKGYVTDGGILLLRETRLGNVDKVVDLLCRGVPFISDNTGVSPLHFAAYNNSVEITELLLNGGILRDLKNKVDRTSLHIAAQMNHVGVLKLLLTYGADPDVLDMMKMTPLHWACEYSHAECVKYLLKYGARVGGLDAFGRTAFDLAKNSEISDLLRNRSSLLNLSRNQQKDKESEDMDVTEEATDIPEDVTDSINTSCSPEPSININKPLHIETDLLPNLNPIPRLINPDKDPMELLKEHGIQMLEPDRITTVRNAVESGQNVVLTEAGKLALDSTLKNEQAKSNVPLTPSAKSIIVVQNGKKCIKIHKSQLSNFQLEHDRSFLKNVGPSASFRFFRGKYYSEDEDEELQLQLQASINKLRSEAKLLDIFSKRKFRQANLYQQQLLSMIKLKNKKEEPNGEHSKS